MNLREIITIEVIRRAHTRDEEIRVCLNTDAVKDVIRDLLPEFGISVWRATNQDQGVETK